MKEKLAVLNNAGKTNWAVTTPMANAYVNATVFEEIENLVATFRHRKSNEVINFIKPRKIRLITELKISMHKVLPKNVFRNLFKKIKFALPETAEKESTTNRVHNRPLYFFRITFGETKLISIKSLET